MKRKIVLVIALLVFTLSLAGVGLNAQDANTLVFAHVGNPASLSPMYDLSTTELVPTSLLFAPLYDRDPQTGVPIPGLTTWELSEDGLVYTFTIREDAVWSDGTPITSADAKFTMEAYNSPEVAATAPRSFQDVKSITIIDDKTFQVELNQVNCANLVVANLRLIPAHRFNGEYAGFQENPFNNAPDVVSGPYLLEEWVPDEYLRFTANPNYFKGEPQIKNIILRIIADPEVRIQSLESGESDYAVMQPEQLEQFTSLENFNTVLIPTDQILHISMNWADPTNPQPAYDEDGNPIEQTPHPILGDVRVRQAIAMGYDREAVLASLGENGGTLVASFFPPSSWAHDPELQPWSYDPERAAQLLDEAGWVVNPDTGIREKDGVPMKLTIHSTSIIAMLEQTALILQDYLTRLNMQVDIVTPEYNVWASDLLGQTYDLAVPSSGRGLDPSANIDGFTVSERDIPVTGLNWDSYVNARVDELAVLGRSVPSCAIEDRLPYYREIERIIHEEVAKDYILVSNQVFVFNKRVQGYNLGYGNTRTATFFPGVETWTLSQ